MKYSAAIVTFVLATLAAAQVPFTSCSTGPTDFALSAFAVSPYPLCSGKISTYAAAGNLLAPIVNGSKLEITGRYLGHVIYVDNHDLCTLLSNQGTPCPVSTPQTALNLGVIVKSTLPVAVPWQWTVNATNGNPSQNNIFCQKTTVTLKDDYLETAYL
ncbi:hypothetical protein BGX34_000458 [Mortierella sp. NVP85]|nr:hypothetical protein BGX34_000458 [Mortierella sp. NVP85]